MVAQARPMHVLLVEDNPGDVRLMRAAVKRGHLPVRVHEVPDGPGALAFLARANGYAGAPRPDLVLLDLNLPGMPGVEVLRQIKQDAGTRGIPVIVLSTSGDPRDVAEAYRSYANCYIRKPEGLAGLSAALARIEEFWFGTAELPEAP